jgi:hypothetical protein
MNIMSIKTWFIRGWKYGKNTLIYGISGLSVGVIMSHINSDVTNKAYIFWSITALSIILLSLFVGNLFYKGSTLNGK